MALPINSLYSLTWGDYGTSLVSAIQLLRCHGDLVDCTLAAGGRSFPAHKIVLCAASPFLFELLKNTPCKHPVVMLAGVNANDLEALLEFVYRGEVSVDHSQLPSLLQAAHCLNIQGLAPQTVTKDDYTTQIQLHQMMPQHHVKTVLDDQEQLIATIAAPQQTVHAQVVEDINTVQTISAPTTVVTAAPQDVKEIINQYLPARKRKPRVKKQPAATVKVARTDGMDNVMTTTTTTIVPDNTETQQQQQQQLHQQQQQQQQQHQQQQQQQQHHQQQQIQTVVTQSQIVQPVVSVPQQQIVTAPIKTESQTETILTVTDATVSPIQTNLANITTGKAKNENNKTRSRSQSEQPATCPICYAVIRQSRNLRRHLELRHFAKPGVKKERKSTSTKKGATSTISAGTTNTNTNNNTSTNNQTGVPQIQTVQTMHTLQGVQVKKEPDTIATTSNIGGTVTVTVAQGQQQQQQIQQLQQIATIDPNGQITTTGGNGQQQIVTQTENTDGTTSLSIANVQTLQGHQLTLGNLNQHKNQNILVKKVFILKGNNNT